MVCDLQDKVNVLWSFIKTHLRSKVIVFLSTCKQVKFMYEAFKKLRPGVPLRSLHGKMKQFKRMAVFYDFCEVRQALLPLRSTIALCTVTCCEACLSVLMRAVATNAQCP